MKKLVLILLLLCGDKLFCQQISIDIGSRKIDTTFTFTDTIQKAKVVVHLASTQIRKKSGNLTDGHSTVYKTVYDSTGRLIFTQTTKALLYKNGRGSHGIYLKQTKISPDGSYKVAIRKRKPSHVVIWYDKNGKKIKKIKYKDMVDNCDNDTWERTMPYTFFFVNDNY